MVHDEGVIINLDKTYKEIINVIITKTTSSATKNYRNVYWDNSNKYNTNKIKFISTNLDSSGDSVSVTYTAIVNDLL